MKSSHSLIFFGVRSLKKRISPKSRRQLSMTLCCLRVDSVTGRGLAYSDLVKIKKSDVFRQGEDYCIRDKRMKTGMPYTIVLLFEFTKSLYDARLKHLGVFLGHCHVGMGEHLAHSLDTHALSVIHRPHEGGHVLYDLRHVSKDIREAVKLRRLRIRLRLPCSLI